MESIVEDGIVKASATQYVCFLWTQRHAQVANMLKIPGLTHLGVWLASTQRGALVVLISALSFSPEAWIITDDAQSQLTFTYNYDPRAGQGVDIYVIGIFNPPLTFFTLSLLTHFSRYWRSR